MSPDRRVPGWYRDPTDRSRMRHWSGTYWDVTHRRVPPWALGTAAVIVPSRLGQGDGPRPEGRVDAAVLPVTARSSARVRAARLGRSMPTAPPPADPAGFPQDGGLGGAPHRPFSARRRLRTSFKVSGMMIVASLLVVAGFVSFSRSTGSDTHISADAAYVTAANAACTSRLGALSSATTPAAVASNNAVLSKLMAALRRLPSAAAVASQTSGWFADWSTFETDQRRQARYLAHHAEHSVPVDHEEAALDRATHTAAVAADTFARTNSLGDCVISGPPAAGTKAF